MVAQRRASRSAGRLRWQPDRWAAKPDCRESARAIARSGDSATGAGALLVVMPER